MPKAAPSEGRSGLLCSLFGELGEDVDEFVQMQGLYCEGIPQCTHISCS